jgi:hypothetical protein
MKVRKGGRTLVSILRYRLHGPVMTRIARVFLISALVGASSPALAREPADPEPAEQTEYQAGLREVLRDKAGYAAAIVWRWEGEAKAIGKWDPDYASNLFGALMQLPPDHLLAAGKASSYQEVMTLVASGHPGQSPGPLALGDIGNDLVYTPVNPCRIVDTRNIGNPISANTTRSFDVDGANFFGQGGFNGACGIPFNVARAVAMTITATAANATGFFTAWSVGSPQPFTSVINFNANQNIANTTIVPVLPGGGDDFFVFSGGATAHVVIDVVGYFAAPTTTALDNNVVRTDTLIAAGASTYDIFSPSCPVGWRLSGGGYLVDSYSNKAPISSRPVVFGNQALTSGINVANAWLCQGNNTGGGAVTISCFAVCARVPGR